MVNKMIFKDPKKASEYFLEEVQPRIIKERLKENQLSPSPKNIRAVEDKLSKENAKFIFEELLSEQEKVDVEGYSNFKMQDFKDTVDCIIAIQFKPPEMIDSLGELLEPEKSVEEMTIKLSDSQNNFLVQTPEEKMAIKEQFPDSLATIGMMIAEYDPKEIHYEFENNMLETIIKDMLQDF